jgi:transposase-like protein
VLLVAVGVREGGAFDVLDWRAASAETTKDYEELLTRLWKRGLEGVELIVSDGLTAILSAAQTVYPAVQHQLCLAHWFRNLEALTPRFAWFQRRKFRREFW